MSTWIEEKVGAGSSVYNTLYMACLYGYAMTIKQKKKKICNCEWAMGNGQ